MAYAPAWPARTGRRPWPGSVAGHPSWPTMDFDKELRAFNRKLLRIRRLLQEGHRLSPEEHRLIKSQLDALLRDLDHLLDKDRKPH